MTASAEKRKDGWRQQRAQADLADILHYQDARRWGPGDARKNPERGHRSTGCSSQDILSLNTREGR